MNYSLLFAVLISVAGFAHAEDPPFLQAFHGLSITKLKNNFKYHPDRGAYPQTIAIYYGGPNVGIKAAGIFDSAAPSDWHANMKIGTSDFVDAWIKRSAQEYVPRDISALDDDTHIPHFSVIWEKVAVPAAFFIEMTDAGFATRYKEYVDGLGYRLADYARYTTRVGNRPPEQKHLAVFRKDGQGFYFYNGIDEPKFRELIGYHEARGYVPRVINGGTYTTSPGFAVIFSPKTKATHVGINLTAAGYQQDYDSYSRAGYRLMKVTGYNKGDRFATVWQKP